MKVGDLVRNVIPLRTNPAVHSPGQEIPRGTIGLVQRIQEETAYTLYPMIDVIMETDSGAAYCGGYAIGFFEVIDESR